MTSHHGAIILLNLLAFVTVLHILSTLLFRTGFYSQEMYELNNIHDRELRNEGMSSSDICISNTNNREEEVKVFMSEI